jgi:hypothetical protein
MATFAFAAEPTAESRVTHAYLESVPVPIEFVQPQGKTRPFALGPWRFGAKVTSPAKGTPEKPHDKRLNMYIVVPGAQQRSAIADDFDHTLIINAKSPAEGAETEFDVYYAVVLDPNLRAEVNTETKLLLAAQEDFRPSDLFALEDVPCARFLGRVLHIDSIADLRRFRKRNGSLPRLAILPAGFALRAVVGTATTASSLY